MSVETWHEGCFAPQRPQMNWQVGACILISGHLLLGGPRPLSPPASSPAHPVGPWDPLHMARSVFRLVVSVTLHDFWGPGVDLLWTEGGPNSGGVKAEEVIVPYVGS